MKNIFLRILLLLNITYLYGCNDNGMGFSGHWKQSNSDNCPSVLTVEYIDGVFHISKGFYDDVAAKKEYDRKIKEYLSGASTYKPDIDKSCLANFYQTKFFVAKALNKNTLQGDDFTMLLKDKKIIMGGEEYLKIYEE
ncbi:hypothetical protein [Escherichia coli]|uniref:hypothetical protein n=1 Tax=Escherichia coli TaxID=562 RepID=UPI0038B2328B